MGTAWTKWIVNQLELRANVSKQEVSPFVPISGLTRPRPCCSIRDVNAPVNFILFGTTIWIPPFLDQVEASRNDCNIRDHNRQ